MSEAPKVIWASVQPTRDGWYQLVNVAGVQIAFPRTKYHHDDTVVSLQKERDQSQAAYSRACNRIDALQAKVARLEAALDPLKIWGFVKGKGIRVPEYIKEFEEFCDLGEDLREYCRQALKETPMTELKEYQHHIADVHEDRKGLAICGARLVGWHYEDIDHAFLSAPRDCMQPCPDCAAKVIAVFSACE